MGLLKKFKPSKIKDNPNPYAMNKAPQQISDFNYDEFNENEKKDLIELEEKAIHISLQLKENMKEIADVFFQAQEIFANNKNGTFGKWYEGLGFKKDFVYLCLEKRNLAITYNNKEVYTLPDRAIRSIKKIAIDDKETVIEILSSENPKEKLKEVIEIINDKKEVNEVYEKLSVRLEKVNKNLHYIETDDKKIEKALALIDKLEKVIFTKPKK